MKNLLATLLVLSLAFPLSARATDSSKIISAVNAERTKKNLPELVTNQTLGQAAQKRAEEMARRSYFSHFGPNGESWVPYFNTYWPGGKKRHIGENLARFRSARESDQKIVKAWIKSKPHKAVMLDRRYTETGVGIATTTKHVYIVQFFGGKTD